MARIIVVGSANVDFVVQTPHIPRPGETVLGRNFVMAMGGKGANQAVGAARLGADVTFVARVGGDVFGDQCLEAYRSEGINVAFVTRDEHEATGVALIAVATSDSENSITVASGANMTLTPDYVRAAETAFRDADALLMQLEVPLESVILAAQIAHDYDVPVILNPAPARSLPEELLRLVDVITPNRIELAQMIGMPEAEVMVMPDEELAHRALGLGPSQAVITLGVEGALAVGSWGRVRVPAFKVTPVDTTAAGDAFNAGLTVALAGQNVGLDAAARYASACGALAVTKFGAQPSLPTAADVEAFLTSQ